MKRILTLFVASFTLMLVAGPNAQAQCVEEGNVIIDPYYGAPNFGKAFVKGLVTTGNNVTATGIGPLGIRAEYLLSDKFGIGVDFIYNTSGVEYTDSFWVDNNANGWPDAGETDLYTYKWTMKRIRVQARFNYHFVATDNLDTYLGVGAGTNMRNWTYESDQPGYTESETGAGTLLPFSMRICLGTRYYFTDNIGINAEIGIGGPLTSAGLSIKF